MLKEFWGQGIAPVASTAIVNKLKENGFNLVAVTHDVNNPKSGRVMQKIGMVYSHSYNEICQPKNVEVIF